MRHFVPLDLDTIILARKLQANTLEETVQLNVTGMSDHRETIIVKEIVVHLNDFDARSESVTNFPTHILYTTI